HVGRRHHHARGEKRRHADVERLELRELLGALLDQVGHAQEQARALARQHRAPASVVGRTRSDDGVFDVGLVTLGDDGLHGAVVRKDGVEGLPGSRVAKLAVDEELVAARGRLGCAGGGGHRGVLLGRSSRLYDDRSAAGKRARRGGRGGPAPYGLVTGGVGKSSISAIASSLMVRIESTPGGKSRVGRARWSGWDTA